MWLLLFFLFIFCNCLIGYFYFSCSFACLTSGAFYSKYYFLWLWRGLTAQLVELNHGRFSISSSLYTITHNSYTLILSATNQAAPLQSHARRPISCIGSTPPGVHQASALVMKSQRTYNQKGKAAIAANRAPLTVDNMANPPTMSNSNNDSNKHKHASQDECGTVRIWQWCIYVYWTRNRWWFGIGWQVHLWRHTPLSRLECVTHKDSSSTFSYIVLLNVRSNSKLSNLDHLWPGILHDLSLNPKIKEEDDSAFITSRCDFVRQLHFRLNDSNRRISTWGIGQL